jgi:hypothetical protein
VEFVIVPASGVERGRCTTEKGPPSGREAAGVGVIVETDMDGDDGDPPDDGPADGPVFDVGVQAHIGAHLRAFYDGVLSEPVPGRITALLDRLAESDRPATHPAAGDGPAPGRRGPGGGDVIP